MHVSNLFCLVLIFIETIFFNGIFAGWNILCEMFKEDDMFCGTGRCSAKSRLLGPILGLFMNNSI